MSYRSIVAAVTLTIETFLVQNYVTRTNSVKTQTNVGGPTTDQSMGTMTEQGDADREGWTVGEQGGR